MSHQQELAGNTPKETLYINNLNDKINQEDMKYGLFFLFQQFGEVLEIVLRKSNSMRGQAFIVFKDITAATNAKKMLNGFQLFNKEMNSITQAIKSLISKTIQITKKSFYHKNNYDDLMIVLSFGCTFFSVKNRIKDLIINQKINFAKQRSEIIDKLEGRWVPKKKLKKHDKNAKKTEEQEKPSEPQRQQEQMQQPLQMQINPQIRNELNQPNNVLILEDLPSFVTTDLLKALFGQYPGFKEVRLIAARKVAFVEFSQEEEATVALNGLQNFQLTPQVFLRLNYAKF